MSTQRQTWLAGMGAAMALLVLVSSGGCNDGIPCPGPSLLVFVSPTSTVTTDLDTVAPGTQVNIRLRTTLGNDAPVDLEIMLGDAVVATRTSAVHNGEVMFDAVDVPAGPVTLRATGYSACGLVRDMVTVDVVAGVTCGLTLDPVPLNNPLFAPIPVLNVMLDGDTATPGLQSLVAVTALVGWRAELFVADDGVEAPFGSAVTDAQGSAAFAVTLPEGRVTLRSLCFGPHGEIVASPSVPVVVDTVAPLCTLVDPGAGTTLNPGFDNNGDLRDGLQITALAKITGEDVAADAVRFAVGPSGAALLEVFGSTVAADGRTTAELTVNPSTTPAVYTLGVAGSDRAGNQCATRSDFAVVYDGCAIAVVSPTTAVRLDADGVANNGAQVDVGLQVSPSCAGRTVTASCAAMSTATVPASGAVTMRLTVCSSLPCESSTACTFAVRSEAGIETRASTTIDFDNQGPTIALALDGGLRCGDTVSATADRNPGLLGVQITATVVNVTGLASSSVVAVTNSAGTSSTPGPTVELTLQPGRNQLVTSALDSLGNQTVLPTCELALTDLTVGFVAPAADGTLGRADGVVAGTTLTAPVCGTVSKNGATVTVALDGGPALPATVIGMTWCRTLTVAQSPPQHVVVAEATVPGSFGRATLQLDVDLTPPPTVNGLTVTTPDRQHALLQFGAPADNGVAVAGYAVRFATVPLSDGNFNTTGTQVATTTPSVPGSTELVAVSGLRAGIAYWFAVASLDAAGNRSVASIVGPVTPNWDQTGAITGPNVTLGNLNTGAAIAHGRFNDDDFDDLAVAAPGQNLGAAALSGAVFVYFGSAAGVTSTPDLILLGGASERFGTALTAMPRGNPARDDLYVGAPGSGDGRVYIFRGGVTFTSGNRTSANADAVIRVAANAGWFAGAKLGTRLGVGQIDDDAVLDLVIAAPGGGGSVGGAVIVYGGTAPGNIALSDVDLSGLGGAVVDLIADPQSLAGRGFGTYLHVVGRTRAGVTRDDILLAYSDDTSTAGDSAYLFRSDGSRGAADTVTSRNFVIGRDVRIDYVTTFRNAEWASQATTIDDLNNDGARELVITAYRGNNGAGQALILRGDVTGNALGIVTTATPGVVLTTIQGANNSRFGTGLVVVRRGGSRGGPDVDGDLREDLLVVGQAGTAARIFTWYGGQIPTGTVSNSTASATVNGPASFGFAATTGGTAAVASWVGDLNHDGLDDVCWASPNDNGRDGSFEVLWDDRR